MEAIYTWRAHILCCLLDSKYSQTISNVLRSQKGGANSKARTYLKMALFQAFTVTSLMLQSFWWKIGQKSHFLSKDQPKISPSFKGITSLWHSLQQKYCPAKRKKVNTAYVEQHERSKYGWRSIWYKQHHLQNDSIHLWICKLHSSIIICKQHSPFLCGDAHILHGSVKSNP